MVQKHKRSRLEDSDNFHCFFLAGLSQQMACPVIPHSNTKTPPSGLGEAPCTFASAANSLPLHSGHLETVVLLLLCGGNHMRSSLDLFRLKVYNLIWYLAM